MEHGKWYHLDNVAKVFLANHNKRDTRCMRLCYTLDEPVDADLLEKALHKTIKSRNQYQVRIRRGLFWHYIEQTDSIPHVCEETQRPCPLLYGKSHRGGLHYQVSYWKNRINLDMFHALADGNGALEFLNIIVCNYLTIKYPEEMKDVVVHAGADAASLNRDGFRHFYEKSDNIQTGGDSPRKAYHIHGLKLPYEQLQFFEVHMSMKEVRARAKEIKVSLTSFLGARLMMALYHDMPAVSKKMPITISMPVNLRNLFPTETGRNFFNSVTVTHVFNGDEDLESLSKEFDVKLKESITREKMLEQMQNYEKIEQLMFTRLVPLAIKQPVVRYFSKKQGKAVSAVLSNMGAFSVPQEMANHIKEAVGYCSTDEIFIVVSSFGDDLTMGISYAFSGTGVLKDYVRNFQKDGIDVRLAATEVVR